MSTYEKIIFSASIITAIFLCAYVLHNLTSKIWHHKYSSIINSSISRALIYISIIINIYIIIRIWDLPQYQLVIANNILFSLTVLVGTLIISSIVSNIIKIYKQTGAHAIAAATLTKNMANAAIFIIGLLIVLNHFGVAIAPMLTAMGIGGIAIALGLQDTLSNIFAGVYIIWAGRMKIGDYIKLSTGEEGYVHDIAWRETRIRMNLDNILTVPNSLISKVAMINYSRPSKNLGFIFSFGVDYKSDLEHVEKITLEIARKIMQSVPGGVPDYEPSIRFKTFSDSSIELNIKMRVRDYAAQSLINHELLKEIHKKFRQENINLPYPTRRIFQENPL